MNRHLQSAARSGTPATLVQRFGSKLETGYREKGTEKIRGGRLVRVVKKSRGRSVDAVTGSMMAHERFSVQPNRALVTCSAEDLIVLKAFANRDQDWLDIEGVLLRQAGRIDEPLIWRELNPLLELKDEPEISPRLERRIARCRQR